MAKRGPKAGHAPFPGSETGGAPKKYTSEFIEKEADAFETWMKKPDSIYFKRFAIQQGYHPNRLAEFAEQNNKFSGVYEQARAWQEVRLAEGGLTNEFNSGFCKFVMGNICGWADRSEAKLTGDAANPLSFLLKEANGRSKDLTDHSDEKAHE